MNFCSSFFVKTCIIPNINRFKLNKNINKKTQTKICLCFSFFYFVQKLNQHESDFKKAKSCNHHSLHYFVLPSLLPHIDGNISAATVSMFLSSAIRVAFFSIDGARIISDISLASSSFSLIKAY